jgi:hypothetical protein
LDISKINIFNKTQKVPNIYFERNEYWILKIRILKETI